MPKQDNQTILATHLLYNCCRHSSFHDHNEYGLQSVYAAATQVTMLSCSPIWCLPVHPLHPTLNPTSCVCQQTPMSTLLWFIKHEPSNA